MGTTNSITMQSLGKIVQCAPAVGAKIWCLYVFCNFFSHAPRPARCSFQGCIVRTSMALPFIARFRRFQRFFQSGLLFQMHYIVLRSVARWRHNFCEIAVKNCEKSKNRRRGLCAPLRIDSWEIWRKFHGSSLRCAPIYFFCARRYLALTASAKIRIGSLKLWLWLCTYVSVFLCGVRWRHKRAPNLEPRFFGQFRTSLRKDSVANYASIWTLFSKSVTGQDVLCIAVNISQVSL